MGLKLITYLGLLFCAYSVQAQTSTIWNENFSSEATGAVTGNNDNTANPANDWTTFCVICNKVNEFSVQGNVFQVSNTDETATWTSETINITDFNNVGVTVDLFEFENLSNSEVVTVSYRLNGGLKTQFPTNGSFSNDFGSQTASVTGLSGTSLIIIIDAYSSATNRRIFFDNINVTGIDKRNATFTSPTLSLTNNNISTVNNYTYTQTIPTSGTYNFGVAAGAVVTITLPNGNLNTVTSATIGGAAATISSKTATTIQLIMPAARAAGSTFNIVLVGVTNFNIIGSYTNSTVSVPNIAGGTNSFNNYAYNLVVSSPPLAFIISDNQPADKVYGQPNFISNTGATTQTGADNSYHTAVDPTTGKVFISDLGNNRVLRYKNIDAVKNGEPAEAVLGQPDFVSNGAVTSQNRFNNNAGIFVGPTGTLWVTGFNSNRVLRFDNASTKANGANADGVLGQTNFTNNGAATTQNGMRGPLCVFEEDDGTLWVADQNNQRILRYNNAALKANGANADGVLGKGNFTTNGTNNSQNRTGAISGVTVNTDGRLYASDLSNNRILWWDNAKTKADGADADGILGQVNYTNTAPGLSRVEFNNPRMVSVSRDNKFLSVSEETNNRIMIFLDPGAVSGEVNAAFVFGQPNYTSQTANNGGLSASSINNPRGVFLYQTSTFQNYLFVSDRGNNRTKLYVLFDIYATTDAYTPIVDTFAYTELDGDPLTFSIVDSTSKGTISIDNIATGKYTYTPKLLPFDYSDTVIYSVCDKDGCDTSVVIFNVLTPKRLWIKADVGIGSTTVTAWENFSNPGDSVRAYTGGSPTRVDGAINYNPKVRFNGTSNRMYLAAGSVNAIDTVYSSMFAVSAPSSVKNQHLLEENLTVGKFGAIDVWGDGLSYFEAGTAFERSAPWGGTVNTPYVWSFLQSNTMERISRNSRIIAPSVTGGRVIGKGDTTRIGYDAAGNFYGGDIAEIILFQNTLGNDFRTGEVNSIESYLAIKYGITLDQLLDNDNDGTLGTDYTLSDTGSTAWEDSRTLGYANDIAGIGRDDFFGLNQKQSRSINVDDIISIGIGTIASTNQLNTNTFTKDSIALMWGNNDGSLANWNNTEYPPSYNSVYRIGREWKVEENLGDVGQVKVEVDSASLPITPFIGNNMFLAIDEDKNGNFTNGNLRLIKMTKDPITKKWSCFVNFNDEEVFTFMFIQFDFMRHGKYFFNQKENVYYWMN